MANISKITLPSNQTYEWKDNSVCYYGVCETAADVQTKVVTIPNFNLISTSNITICIKFLNGNTASNPLIQINDITPVSIYSTSDNKFLWDNIDYVKLFRKAGTNSQWQIIDYSKIEVIQFVENPTITKHTITVTASTPDDTIVTGQKVYIKKYDGYGPITKELDYNGSPISFSLKEGEYFGVEISDNLYGYFSPAPYSGVVGSSDINISLSYTNLQNLQRATNIKRALDRGLDLSNTIGQQISCNWNETTLIWDIVDYDNDTVTLMTHDTLPRQLSVEPVAALIWCKEPLLPGVYKFSENNSSWYFTITNTIPANGQLCTDGSSFTTYSSRSSTVALETGEFSTTAIADAINLRELSTVVLNKYYRAVYGSNNYKEGGLFQWLNSYEAANTPMPRTIKFSRPYKVLDPGFLGALDKEFESVLDNTIWLCSANTAYEYSPEVGGTTTASSTYSVTAKVGLASAMEIFGSYDGVPDGSHQFDYFINSTAEQRQKYQPGTSTARHWWLRSPHYRNDIYDTATVNTDGDYSAANTKKAFGVVPVVKISKTPIT